MIVSVAFPHIAQQCGWISAEVGRQPWIVWKLMRASEGVSTNITASQVLGSIIMFIIIYSLLFALFLFLLDRKIKHGPEEVRSKKEDLLYRNLMKG
jgi:cytochrome d ubiquinol oxidase subunit I